jgi:1-acyl-sn-glycerol-3-phosphate acyltransferase
LNGVAIREFAIGCLGLGVRFIDKSRGSVKSDDVLSEQSLAEQTSAATQINKSVLVFPEPRRVRDRDHVRHVIRQPCLVCGRRPSDPHHLRFAQSRALGRKVSDEFTVPLCRAHHREVHRCGDEGLWWQKTGIDPLAAARALWLRPPSTVAKNRLGSKECFRFAFLAKLLPVFVGCVRKAASVYTMITLLRLTCCACELTKMEMSDVGQLLTKCDVRLRSA